MQFMVGYSRVRKTVAWYNQEESPGSIERSSR